MQLAYGIAVDFYITLKTAGTNNFQANPTLVAGDVQISIDGGTFNNLTTLPSAVPAAGNQVKIPLSAAEVTGKVMSIHFIDAAGAEWDDLEINIETYGHASSLHPNIGEVMRGTDNAATETKQDATDVVIAELTAQGDTNEAAIGALNNIAATDIVSAGAITTLSGAVVNVDLVDTCTANSDMRGTDSAALASVCTEVRLAELGAGNLPADFDTLLTESQSHPTLGEIEASTVLAKEATIGSIKTQTDKITFTAGDNVQSELAAERFADFTETIY